MASSALSIVAVQSHYLDFLERNHLWTALLRLVSKLLREFHPPSNIFLSLSPLVSSQSEKKWLQAASLVTGWCYRAGEPTEFRSVTLTQMFFFFSAELCPSVLSYFLFLNPGAQAGARANKMSETRCDWDGIQLQAWLEIESFKLCLTEIHPKTTVSKTLHEFPAYLGWIKH